MCGPFGEDGETLTYDWQERFDIAAHIILESWDEWLDASEPEPYAEEDLRDEKILSLIRETLEEMCRGYE